MDPYVKGANGCDASSIPPSTSGIHVAFFCLFIVPLQGTMDKLFWDLLDLTIVQNPHAPCVQNPCACAFCKAWKPLLYRMCQAQAIAPSNVPAKRFGWGRVVGWAKKIPNWQQNGHNGLYLACSKVHNGFSCGLFWLFLSPYNALWTNLLGSFLTWTFFSKSTCQIHDLTQCIFWAKRSFANFFDAEKTNWDLHKGFRTPSEAPYQANWPIPNMICNMLCFRCIRLTIVVHPPPSTRPKTKQNKASETR
jgi:hypothetical protein